MSTCTVPTRDDYCLIIAKFSKRRFRNVPMKCTITVRVLNGLYHFSFFFLLLDIMLNSVGNLKVFLVLHLKHIYDGYVGNYLIRIIINNNTYINVCIPTAYLLGFLSLSFVFHILFKFWSHVYINRATVR